MATRFDDDEELDMPVVKKRRRPKKIVSEDDEDGGPGARRGAEEEEDEENNFTTGNVALDIVLDFRDDCIDWAKDNPGRAIASGVILFLVLAVLGGLTIRYIINYVNRPTLPVAMAAYDLGSYGEAKRFAEIVLKYASPEDLETRGGALFILGASTCSIAEIAWNTNRQPYYLAAANYLLEAEKYGFPVKRRAEGFFLLGKSLYLSGRLSACREPLHFALQYGDSHEKTIYWYLANSHFLEANPDYAQALRFVRQFKRSPLVTEDERYEADMLESMILIQTGNVQQAEAAFLRVPLFDRFETMRHFVSGQIAFSKARSFRQQAIDLETNRNPMSVTEIPVAPAPVSPKSEPDPNPPQVPKDLPKLPFEEPETEKLLPQTAPAPPSESSFWPIFPAAPTPATSGAASAPAPVPDDCEDPTEHPLFRRMSLLQEQAEPPVARDAGETFEPEKKENASGTASKRQDPDRVLVLPSQSDEADRKRETVPAPSPPTLPEIDTDRVTLDLKQQRAKGFRERAAEKYKEAIEHFQHVRRRDSFVPRWVRTAALLEGMSYEEMDEPDKAGKAYLDLGQSYPSTSEAAAADFLWAEVEFRLGRPENALSGYVRAFDTLREEPDYTCIWLPKPEILLRYEEHLHENLPLREYKRNLSMLHIARDVLPDDERARLTGETYELWAESLRQRSTSILGAEGNELEKESRDKYRRAGAAFERYARFRYDASDYDDQIWRSAENYRAGRDYRRAVPAYRQYLTVNWKDRQPEALYYLGEMFLHLDGLDEAIEYLERALNDYPAHALVPRIRIALSKAYIEKKQWDQARNVLQANLIGPYTPSSAIYRDSMYALGRLSYDRGHPLEAIPFLEDAIKIHPNAIQAVDAHYCLAQAYLARSGESLKSIQETHLENVRRELSNEAIGDREKALRHIWKTEELLVQRQNAIGLTESERLMLRNTLFGAGYILMQLHRYEKAISTFDIAASRYQDRPEAIDALMQIVVAYRRLNRSEDAIPILNRAEVLLNQLVKLGTIPSDNRWEGIIRLQKDILRMKE